MRQYHSRGPAKMGASRILSLSQDLKSRGKHFMAERLKQALLECSPESLQCEDLREALRDMDQKEMAAFVLLFSDHRETELIPSRSMKTTLITSASRRKRRRRTRRSDMLKH